MDVDVRSWRKATREALVAARESVPAADRTELSREIGSVLDELIGPGPGQVISVYWPIRGELDLRAWMRSAHERGARIALPVVVAKDQPLVFREWLPGCKLTRGVWGIPAPEETGELTPTVVIAPLVGFDRERYRLGNGGGYFDRTLAVLPAETRAIGVGSPAGELPTIYPQPHDVPMDVIVGGRGRVLARKA